MENARSRIRPERRWHTDTSGHLSERVRKNQVPCDECGRAYSAKKNLERHVQQHHMKEKCQSGLFSCFFEGCQHAGDFRRATDLVSHCEKNHPGLLIKNKTERVHHTGNIIVIHRELRIVTVA